MMLMFKRFVSDCRGATAIEYGLTAGLISVVIITSLSTLGSGLSSKFNSVGNAMS